MLRCSFYVVCADRELRFDLAKGPMGACGLTGVKVSSASLEYLGVTWKGPLQRRGGQTHS
jgi:hypothetical protein